MLFFTDGVRRILSFEEVELLYYLAYLDEFQTGVSITQWRGTYEYQALYPAIQLSVENGVIMSDVIDAVQSSLTESSEVIKRPAVLQSRVSERFAEAGYDASIRPADLTNAGIVAIAIDYETGDAVEEQAIAQLISDEMLPAGQHMEGDITYNVTLSNGQSVPIAWRQATTATANFRITYVLDRNSPVPEDPAEVVQQKFYDNFNAIMRLGSDIRPELYFTFEDAPYASDITVEFDPLGGEIWQTDVYYSQFFEKFIANLDIANIVVIQPTP